MVRKADPAYQSGIRLYRKALEHVRKQTDKEAMVYSWMHSKGTIYGAAILDNLSKEELRYIRPRTFGAGGYMFRNDVYVQHYGNMNPNNWGPFKKDFVPTIAGMDMIRNKSDIDWEPVDKAYVHGFDSYIRAHIVKSSKKYFAENASVIISR